MKMCGTVDVEVHTTSALDENELSNPDERPHPQYPKDRRASDPGASRKKIPPVQLVARSLHWLLLIDLLNDTGAI
jgi:hypothetical protein